MGRPRGTGMPQCCHPPLTCWQHARLDQTGAGCRTQQAQAGWQASGRGVFGLAGYARLACPWLLESLGKGR